MSLTVFKELEQGTPEWLEARRGLITASVVGQFITPTGKVSASETSRAAAVGIIAERITGRIEQIYVSQDMERGNLEEPLAREKYEELRGPVAQVGFMVRDFGGFKVGYSPDGLVGDDGLIEIKSRKPKKHIQTVLADVVPPENMAQIQAGLLVSGRAWCDYISYCGGEPLWVKRVVPDEKWFEAIREVAAQFEVTAENATAIYFDRTQGMPRAEYIDWFGEEDITL
ncbi:lambda exonuclease family protein [Timonella senegalensis]|uniref:lambda exonuclease family protein n=1 Tax=Timonella senegalensis TaxID=1465825 RepID=UPI0002DFE78F|nr:lambda exonuclease family protein [Timonella senegalensis]